MGWNVYKYMDEFEIKILSIWKALSRSFLSHIYLNIFRYIQRKCHSNYKRQVWMRILGGQQNIWQAGCVVYIYGEGSEGSDSHCEC